MKKDIYGQCIMSENDICELLLKDPNTVISNALVDFSVKDNLDIDVKVPELIYYEMNESLSVAEFDDTVQQNWYMPENYNNLDIKSWLINQCTTVVQKTRVETEWILFKERNLVKLLQYLKFLVDTMRKNNIVWGVGRGSSVSSYILFLIGVHKIDSIYYDLDINEFLR